MRGQNKSRYHWLHVLLLELLIADPAPDLNGAPSSRATPAAALGSHGSGRSDDASTCGGARSRPWGARTRELRPQGRLAGKR